VCYSLWYNTQSSAPEDGQNNCPKHIELTGIINKPLLLHIVGCLYYLYQRCTFKQISANEIYLLIKYIKKLSLESSETPVLYTGRTFPKGLFSDLSVGRVVLVAGRSEFGLLKNCTVIDPRIF